MRDWARQERAVPTPGAKLVRVPNESLALAPPGTHRDGHPGHQALAPGANVAAE